MVWPRGVDVLRVRPVAAGSTLAGSGVPIIANQTDELVVIL